METADMEGKTLDSEEITAVESPTKEDMPLKVLIPENKVDEMEERIRAAVAYAKHFAGLDE